MGRQKKETSTDTQTPAAVTKKKTVQRKKATAKNIKKKVIKKATANSRKVINKTTAVKPCEIVAAEQNGEIIRFGTAAIGGSIYTDKIIPERYLSRGYTIKWVASVIERYLLEDKTLLETIKAPENSEISQIREGQAINSPITPLNTKVNDITALQTWYEMVNNVAQVGSIWRQSQQIKAGIIAENAQEYLKSGIFSLPPELFTIQQVTSENGVKEQHKVLTAAGITYLKSQYEAAMLRARTTERGHLNDKRKETINSIVINQNIKVDLRELMQKDISELAEVQF